MLPPPSEDTRIAELNRRVDNLESALRAAFTTITGGRGLTIADGGRVTIKGGALVVEDDEGNASVWFGAVLPRQPDGTQQPGMILFREDGTVAMAMYDPSPDPSTPGGYKQFLAIFDRAGNIIFSDDTDSGQGIARPYVGGHFAAHRFEDFRYSTSAAAFETVASYWVTKQSPRLRVTARASMDASGTTGEMRALVGGVPLGATTAEAFAITTRDFGPAPIAGDHMQRVLVEIQGRRTSASGALRIEPMGWEGVQS